MSREASAQTSTDDSLSSQALRHRPSHEWYQRFPKSIDRWIDPQIRRRCLTRFVLIPDRGPAVFLSLPGYRFGQWSIPSWPGSSQPNWTQVCDAPGPRLSLPASHEMIVTSVRNPAIRLGRLSGFVVRVLGKGATSIEAYASVDRDRLSGGLQTVLEPARDPLAILLSEPISDAHSELWLGFRSTVAAPSSRIQICGLLLQL